MDEAEFARHIDLGRENARIMGLAANHCRHMRFVESGGRGMLEEMSGLPLNSRRVECPVAIGNMSGMRLDYVTFGFYGEHCVGCHMRAPTGSLPNLETEAQERQQQAQAEEAERAEELRVRGVARAGRVERRRSLRATAELTLLTPLRLGGADRDVEVAGALEGMS